MKNVEERLKELPRLAESTGLQADEELKQKIMRRAREEAERRQPRSLRRRRLIPVLCAAAVLIGVGVFALSSRPAGPRPTDVQLLSSQPAGQLQIGDTLAWDVPQNSISIKSSRNPSFRSIWAPATGGNFPLIGLNGCYYRLLTNPTAISNDLLGEGLGTVDTFTSEPALAGKAGVWWRRAKPCTPSAA